MEKIESLTELAIPLNLSEKVDLQRDLNNDCFASVSPQTIALVTLRNAVPAEKDSLVMLSLN